MSLAQLNIHSVRNLRNVALADLGRVNVFYGDNGSGKTSVLEAVHLLGMARSFRSTSARSLITHGDDSCTVYGAASAPGGQGSPVGIGVQRRLTGEAEIKVSGRPVRAVADLIEQLPVLVINADSFDLLNGSPRTRRQYLDWGVFHVEHAFFAQWQRFQRCIKQRNNLLRRDKIPASEVTSWTRDLITSGSAINGYRLAYFERLAPCFKGIMASLVPELENLELRYRRGWDKSMSFEEALANSYSADCERGYTHVGPQRADMRVTVNGHSAADTLSRGQQKLLVCGLKLAQGRLMADSGPERCVYLVDDLPSELDRQHSILVAKELEAMKAQVFITCVERADIESVWPSRDSLSMFHVEHGEIRVA